MGSSNVAVNLLIASCVLSCLAIGCFAAGLIGNVWWINETSIGKDIKGLWKTCVESKNGTICHERDDIFTFDDKRGTDPIMACMLLSAFFIVISILLSLSTLCCCRRNALQWKKSAKWNAIIQFIAVAAITDAMLYTEIEFYKLFQENTRGWSYFITWAGTGLQIIVFIITLAQLCLKPKILVTTRAW